MGLSEFQGETDGKERTSLTIGFPANEREQLENEATEGEYAAGPLVRLVVRRVREYGDGDLLDGIARLRLAQKDGMQFDSGEFEE